MIDLLSIEPAEAERLAYAEGFGMAAQLFARIVDLQRELDGTTKRYKAAIEAVNELVAEADDPVGWDGHQAAHTYGFELARKVIEEHEKC